MSEKQLSLIIPIHNEEENINPLYKEITEVLKQRFSYEIIFIDDGSNDSSLQKLLNLQQKDQNILVIKLSKNFGQTAAMDIGFKTAKGKIFIPIDADLQNDPKDIPNLIKKIESGFDVVSGWRKNRQDSFLKKITSKLANTIRYSITKGKIHDSGCTLKAYKKKCFQNFDLSQSSHRFIPDALALQGFKVSEIIVGHRSRKHGKSHYKWKRIFKGFKDLLLVRFQKTIKINYDVEKIYQ